MRPHAHVLGGLKHAVFLFSYFQAPVVVPPGRAVRDCCGQVRPSEPLKGLAPLPSN